MSNLEKLSANDLKARLKDAGMVQQGDKGTLIFRLKLFEQCNSLGLSVTLDSGESINPCSLKFADLKKIASRKGVSPIGTQDEILASFVAILAQSAKQAPAPDNNSTSSSSKDATDANARPAVDAVAIARRIMELDDVDDLEGILNLGHQDVSQPITKQSSVATMRKAYLKLSLFIHPDKLGRTFDQATKAFQCLVKAFEQLSSPDMTNEDTGGGDDTTSAGGGGRRGSAKANAKPATIARSNEGCYRTRVCCPRCRQPWSEGTLDGNPDYFYNFLMQGLKCFSCSTCLCEFGCMTAIHRCPHCSKCFEYSIADYHRKIVCSNQKCKKPFGFFMFPASDRVLVELRNQLKLEQEARLKTKAAKLRRSVAAGRRDARSGKADMEQALLIGLVDYCPRCGESLDECPDEDSRREHLMNCLDEQKHMKHKKNEEEKLVKAAAKQAKLDKQESVQTQAAWTFLGSKSSQLWILDDEHVQAKALEMGVSAAGSKEELIERIVSTNKAAKKRGVRRSLDSDSEEEQSKSKSKRGAKKRGSGWSDDDISDEEDDDDGEVEIISPPKRGSGPLRLTATAHAPSSSSSPPQSSRTSRASASASASATASSSSSSAVVATDYSKTSLVAAKKKRRVSVDSLPANLYSMTVPQLRSVCASNGLLSLLTASASKDEIIAVLEDCLYD